jgi:protein-S-isoprenylcysteine O-methyltransferase Ste14
MNWQAFTRSKIFDLLMAVPLIAWFGYSAANVRSPLVYDAQVLVRDPADLYTNLHFYSLLASLAFNLLLIWMLLVRTTPVKKSQGLIPRLCAAAGTFLGVGILHLPFVHPPLPWMVMACILTLAGGLGSVIVLARLGKAFAIMPEARMLVTSGPYAYARHPLYAVEFFTIIGIAMQFEQPWAGLLGAAVIALQVIRSVFEERVLVEAYPEYAAYRARTKRFIPGVI